MLFKGYSIVFSTKNDKQYDDIGYYWDLFSSFYPLESIRGLGFNWTNNTIEYILECNEVNKDLERELHIFTDARKIPLVYKCVLLPDDNYTVYTGKTSELESIYKKIYAKGKINYEIEQFYHNDECKISVIMEESKDE